MTSEVLAAAPRPGPKAQIWGLSLLRQDDERWADEPYRYDSILGFSRSNGNIHHLGCSITSLTNILNWSMRNTGDQMITPADTNFGRIRYSRAMLQTRFKDLTGNGKDVLKPSPRIAFDSPRGAALQDSIRESVRNDRPVLIGIAGGKKDGKNYPRHSLVAAGVDERGSILVLDPWRSGPNGGALYTTLDEAREFHGNAPSLDMAFEARRLNR